MAILMAIEYHALIAHSKRVSDHSQIRDGAAAWQTLQEAVRELGAINRDALIEQAARKSDHQSQASGDLARSKTPAPAGRRSGRLKAIFNSV